MTHDPRLATLEQVMNGSPFDIIDSPWGHIECWRASTLATGTMGALAQVYEMVRNDAAEAVARADEAEARKQLVQHLCDQIATMQNKITALEDALEARHKADAEEEEREAEFEEEPLELPPDISDHQELSPPQKIGDEVHQPTGDLHTLAAKEEPSPSEDEEPSSELPEPPLEDALGGPPKSVPLSYVHSEDQAEFAIPEPQMTTDARRRKPRGGVVSQPVSVSLNEQ